jgi:hypothetical protein
MRGQPCRALSVAVAAVLAHTSCSESFATEPGPGAECSINSDCPEPLRCAFDRCHSACEETRDCLHGQRCVASDRPFHVCQLPDETKCAYNSDCPGSQICGANGECRDPCATERDCVKGQLCVERACVEPSEAIDAGARPVVDSGSSTNGSRCTFSSDCPAPYVCHEGNCRLECVAEPDCPPNYRCSSNRCIPPICGGEQSDIATLGGAACRFSSECPFPLVCRRGFCNCDCLGDRDCATGHSCVEHRCAPIPKPGTGGTTGTGGSGGTGGSATRDAGADASVAFDAGRRAP